MTTCQVQSILWLMKTLTVGKLKTNFSKVLEDVRKGQEIIISFGKKMEKIAVIIPFINYKNGARKIGILDKKAKCIIKSNFKLSDEDFLKA